MSRSAKREALARIHGRYERAGRPHKTRILEEICATCGYHRNAALRLLNRPLPTTPPKRSDPPDTTRPGSVEADTVAHGDDSTEGDYVHSLTLTELYSGWTENRAVWNKSAAAVLAQLQALEKSVPYPMTDFHTDNGGEFLHWALHRHLTGRTVKLPWTRRPAYRKNDNAHCEQKNWTLVRQLFGH